MVSNVYYVWLNSLVMDKSQDDCTILPIHEMFILSICEKRIHRWYEAMHHAMLNMELDKLSIWRALQKKNEENQIKRRLFSNFQVSMESSYYLWCPRPTE